MTSTNIKRNEDVALNLLISSGCVFFYIYSKLFRLLKICGKQMKFSSRQILVKEKGSDYVTGKPAKL